MSVFTVHGFSRKFMMLLDSQAQKTEAVCRGITRESHRTVWIKKIAHFTAGLLLPSGHSLNLT